MQFTHIKITRRNVIIIYNNYKLRYMLLKSIIKTNQKLVGNKRCTLTQEYNRYYMIVYKDSPPLSSLVWILLDTPRAGYLFFTHSIYTLQVVIFFVSFEWIAMWTIIENFLRLIRLVKTPRLGTYMVTAG